MDSVWVRTRSVLAVGGVTDVGFSDDDSYLLVLSHSGRGVIDCETGERAARDDLDDWSFLDDVNGRAEGIGPLAGQHIPVAGLMSDRLLTRTNSSGWTLTGLVDGVEPTASADSFSMMGPIEGVEVTGPAGQVQRVLESVLEIRACGFGTTGLVWVLATTASIDFFHRNPDSQGPQ